MGRLFAIDYGRKRVGIAVTDELQIIANALTTVRTVEIFDFISQYLTDNVVDAFIIGYPLNMNGQPSESTKDIEPFVNKLRKTYPHIPIYRVDERFTSVIAKDVILQTGVKKVKRQDKTLVDKISATIILQSFMENPNFYINKSKL